MSAQDSAENDAWLDDALCDALCAARSGKYDGMTVEQHLVNLIERVRRTRPIPPGEPR